MCRRSQAGRQAGGRATRAGSSSSARCHPHLSALAAAWRLASLAPLAPPPQPAIMATSRGMPPASATRILLDVSRPAAQRAEKARCKHVRRSVWLHQRQHMSTTCRTLRSEGHAAPRSPTQACTPL